ncbi:MAG: hypothetical protein AB1679_18565 [Actinomycetota bacterium]
MVTNDSVFDEDDVPSDSAGPPVTRRRSTRTESVNWWRTVLKETSGLIRNDLERRRRAEAAAWAEQLATLREMFSGTESWGGGNVHLARGEDERRQRW